jgi:hypothetical protein
MPLYQMDDAPTPPASLKDLHADSGEFSARIELDDKAAQPTYTIKLEPLAEHLSDWTLRIVSAVCALLFGIWAPLSYQLQKRGNKSNDEEIIKLLEEVKSLNGADAYNGYAGGFGALRKRRPEGSI